MPKFNDINKAADALTGARKLRTVTPHATNALPDGVADCLWINDNAVVTVAVVSEDDTTAITHTISGPGRLDIRAAAVRVTGTTAASIVAWY